MQRTSAKGCHSIFALFSGTLTQLDAPGHFQQQLYFFGIPGPSVDYNVIYIDEEVAVEYDCNDSWLFGRDYCVHILSRKPTLSQEKVDEMIAFAGSIISILLRGFYLK